MSYAWCVGLHFIQPNLRGLKATTTSISLRLPDALLAHIKAMANKLDVPYQSLMKLWLAEKLDEAEKRNAPAKRLAAR